MKQIAFSPNSHRKTRKQKFLHQMDQVVPWSDLVDRISPYYPECKTERGPVQLQTLLRTHFMQQWFELSDPAMEEAFYDTPVFREFAQTDKTIRLPDENTIMRFRYRLEKYKLDEHLQKKLIETLAQQGFVLTTGAVKDAELTPTNDNSADVEALAAKTTQTTPTPIAQPQAQTRADTSSPSLPTHIKLLDEDTAIYLQYQPIEGQAELNLQTLQTLIQDHGFADCAFDSSTLQTAIEKCNRSTVTLKAAIGKRIDAKLTVMIAEDEMSARVHLHAAQGGKAMTADGIVRTLHIAGVVTGVDELAVAALLSMASAENVLVAQGRFAAKGENTVFEELVSKAYSEEDATDLDGRIDYRTQNSILMVTEGDPLVRRIPATQGIEGVTVTGRALEALPGEETDFPAGLDGARISETDPNLLIAAIAGHPVPVTNGMRVEPVIRLAEVNLTTGNIDFDGAVQIDGDVIQGMKVKATGDILIKGVVERSFIETPGDILVKGGVIGDAHLNAGGMVRARFGQSATIQSGKSIEIEEMAMQCLLTAHEGISVGSKVPQRGRLVGGIARALKFIKVPFLGSEEGTLTRVIVGVHEELESKFRTLQFAIFDKQSNVENLTKIVNQLTRTGDPKNLLDRAKASLLETQNAVVEMESESQSIDDKLNLLRRSKVEFTQEATGMVEVTVANYKVRLTKSYGRGQFGLSDENRVVHIDPKGFSGLAN